MKKTILTSLLLLFAIATFAQETNPNMEINTIYKMVDIDTLPLLIMNNTRPTLQRVKGSRLLVLELPDQVNEYDVTFTFTKVIKYDTTYVVYEVIDNDPTKNSGIATTSKLTYTGANWVAGTGLSKFYNSTFHYRGGATDGNGTINLAFKLALPGKVEVGSERFIDTNTSRNHKPYSIFIDGKLAGTVNPALAPYNSDKDHGVSSFISKKLTAGDHTIMIQPTGQMAFDRFILTKMVLVPKN